MDATNSKLAFVLLCGQIFHTLLTSCGYSVIKKKLKIIAHCLKTLFFKGRSHFQFFDFFLKFKLTGDFSVTILNISKDKYHATVVERSVKSVQEAIIQGLNDGLAVLTSALEWRIISEAELAASESAEGTLVSHGTAEWTINKRSLPAGIYQVKFTASYTIGDYSSPYFLAAFDYGFIEVIPAPVRAIIDGGSHVRWGSGEIVTVDGSLSYDGDIGPGNHTGLSFAWSCFNAGDNASISSDCYRSLVRDVDTSAVSIDPGQLTVGKTYILRLTVSKNERSSLAEMSFEVAEGEVPHVALR